MKIPFTDEDSIREAILKEENFDKNFFVEAGAGAGKTSLIATRIVNQLKSGKYAPSEIIAITFTNEATRSLKKRIYDILCDELKKSAISDSEKNNLEASRKDLDSMQISTIHSLCHRILSEKAFDVGLPMGFELLDPADEDKYLRSFMVKWAEDHMNYSDWDELKETAYTKKDPDDKAKAKRNAFYGLQHMTADLYALPEDVKVVESASGKTATEIEKDVDAFLVEFEAELVKAISAVPFAPHTIEDIPDAFFTAEGKKIRKLLVLKKKYQLLQTLCGCIGGIFNTSLKGKAEAYVKEEEKKEPKPAKAKSKTSKQSGNTDAAAGDQEKPKSAADIRKEKAEKILNDIIAAYSDFDAFITKRNSLPDPSAEAFIPVPQLFMEYEELLNRKYVVLGKQASEAYRKYFPVNLVTNNNMLTKTYELLKASKEAIAFFSDKFKCIYVDEFQDTDHVQYGFIKLLAEDLANPGCLRNGALFVVGDPKQSIYRFRGAEPDVYFKAKDYFDGLDNAWVCNLSYNFRSDASIIKWVNDQFKDREIVGSVGSYVPMVQAPVNAEKSLPKGGNLVKGVYSLNLLEGAVSSDGNSLETGDDSDEDKLCKLIEYLKRNKKIDRGTGTPDDIKYGDFLVLCCYTPGMDEYANKMKAYGIPFTMIAKTEPASNYYLNAFITLYAYLNDPYDRKAREGARSILALSGVGDDDIENVLDGLTGISRSLSGYGCLEYLLDHPELILKKDTDIDKYETADLLKKLHQIAETMMTSGYKTGEDILEAMRDYLKGEIKKEICLQEEKDAVSFMNLHQAKGLEGNIVIWTNRRENVELKDGDYMTDLTYYPAVSYNKQGKPATRWSSYKGNNLICDKAQKDNDQENIRLEYVAATRAKQVLIFMESIKGENNLFRDYSVDTALDVDPSMIKVGSDPSDDYTVVSQESAEARKAGKESAKARSQKTYVSKIPSELEDKAAEKGKKDMDTESDRVRGYVVGHCIHRAFELLIERSEKIFGAFTLPSDKISDMCILQALNENSDELPDGEYNEYLKLLTDAMTVFKGWFTGQDVFKNADTFYTELPFFYMTDRLGNGEKKNIPYWMHGESDLVIRLKDGSYHVIDYKSDDDTKFMSEAGFVQYLNEKYTPQIVEYKKAVSSIFGVDENKVSASLISFSYMDENEWINSKSMRVRETTI